MVRSLAERLRAHEQQKARLAEQEAPMACGLRAAAAASVESPHPLPSGDSQTTCRVLRNGRWRRVQDKPALFDVNVSLGIHS
jgi:hypothetical protein